MDAMTQMAAYLNATHSTAQCGGWRKCKTCKAAKSRNEYRRNREAWQWRWKLRRLAEMAAVLFGDSHANH